MHLSALQIFSILEDLVCMLSLLKICDWNKQTLSPFGIKYQMVRPEIIQIDLAVLCTVCVCRVICFQPGLK